VDPNPPREVPECDEPELYEEPLDERQNERPLEVCPPEDDCVVA